MTPNITAFRIDERLIHGQGQMWIKALGVNTVIVANDTASQDPMQQTLMKAVVRKSMWETSTGLPAGRKSASILPWDRKTRQH